MAKVLSDAGFVIYNGKAIIDADKNEMGKVIRGFGKQLRHYTTRVFYFAGHGAQIEGTNFLFPTDAKLQDKGDAKWELIDINAVLGEMGQKEGALNIVILDACRNNPLLPPGELRDAAGGLGEMKAPRGTWIAYASAPGRPAIDSMGAHSPYTQALVDTLEEQGLTLYQVFNKVALRVEEETNNKQEPWNSQSPISKDFYFRPATTGILELHVQPSAARLRLDGQDVGTADGFRRPLPKGQHEYVVEAEGYDAHHATVTIHTGSERTLDISLNRHVDTPTPDEKQGATGFLELEISTPGATVTVDGVDYGAARGFRQRLPSGFHQLRVDAPGFQSRSERVEVAQGSIKTLFFDLISAPTSAPPTAPAKVGVLTLDIRPETAVVSLDGKLLGLAAGFRRELSEGEHQIELRADGYESEKKTVAVGAGGERSVSLVLNRIRAPAHDETEKGVQPSHGHLDISTDPPIAKIRIDNLDQPIPGAASLDVTPGEHTVTASGTGLVTQTKVIKVEPGATLQISLQILHKPPSNPPRPGPQTGGGGNSIRSRGEGVSGTYYQPPPPVTYQPAPRIQVGPPPPVAPLARPPLPPP